MHRNILKFAALSIASIVFLLSACNSESGHVSAQSAARCANCGMRVPSDSAWRAGLTNSEGEALSFDAPKCMFRVLRGERGHGAREPWVIEYDSRTQRPANSLMYVIGSDVEGPMGRDLVPIASRERAERFVHDHHGTRILTFDEVTAQVVDALFRRE
jgi:nitrous oxide reductase accessory protein NosL